MVDGEYCLSWGLSLGGDSEYLDRTLNPTDLYLAPCAFSDLNELDLPATMKTEFPDLTDLLHFNLTISPDEGKPATWPSCF